MLYSLVGGIVWTRGRWIIHNHYLLNYGQREVVTCRVALWWNSIFFSYMSHVMSTQTKLKVGWDFHYIISILCSEVGKFWVSDQYGHSSLNSCRYGRMTRVCLSVSVCMVWWVEVMLSSNLKYLNDLDIAGVWKEWSCRVEVKWKLTILLFPLIGCVSCPE